MKRLLLGIYIASTILLPGCTSIVTAPIDVASSVVGAGFHIIGEAGGAIVNTVTGGGSDEKDSGD